MSLHHDTIILDSYDNTAHDSEGSRVDPDTVYTILVTAEGHQVEHVEIWKGWDGAVSELVSDTPLGYRNFTQVEDDLWDLGFRLVKVIVDEGAPPSDPWSDGEAGSTATAIQI